jgi:hypothetical protein
VEFAGTVALGNILIKSRSPERYVVDRDALIAEVMKPITRIGIKETKAIAKFVAGLKEPDET